MQDQFLKNEDALRNIPLELVVKVALLFILMFILISMVNAFFTAGAIGMAGQALEKGKPDNGIMWSAGKKHFWNMFQASVLMGFIMVTGLVFVLPAIALQPKFLQAEPQPMSLLLMGVLLLRLYVLALSMILATAPYALVVKNLGPMQAILASIDFFRYNKFDVLVLWLVVVAISISMQMIFGLFSSENGIENQTLTVVTGLVNILVLAPLTNLWWTRLYMDRKGILKVDEVKDIW
jgi:flagellar biosynthesis protein FliQ